jgi:hypothetical protein
MRGYGRRSSLLQRRIREQPAADISELRHAAAAQQHSLYEHPGPVPEQGSGRSDVRDPGRVGQRVGRNLRQRVGARRRPQIGDVAEGED